MFVNYDQMQLQILDFSKKLSFTQFTYCFPTYTCSYLREVWRNEFWQLISKRKEGVCIENKRYMFRM